MPTISIMSSFFFLWYTYGILSSVCMVCQSIIDASSFYGCLDLSTDAFLHQIHPGMWELNINVVTDCTTTPYLHFNVYHALYGGLIDEVFGVDYPHPVSDCLLVCSNQLIMSAHQGNILTDGCFFKGFSSPKSHKLFQSSVVSL